MDHRFSVKDYYLYLVLIALLAVTLFVFNPVLGTLGVIAWVISASYAYRTAKKFNETLSEQFQSLHKDFEKVTERAIFSMPFPMVVTDKSGVIMWHNSHFATLLDGDNLRGNVLQKEIPDLGKNAEEEEDGVRTVENGETVLIKDCLLYTSDAADE